MRICFPVSEIFAYGFYGGFGSLTRSLAKGLSDKGHEVYVVTPRLSDKQKPVEVMDGFTVVSHSLGVRNYLRSKFFYDEIDADVYHSEEPNIGTWLAMKVKPYSKHIITFQDPRTLEEKRREWDHLGLLQRLRMEVICRGLLYYSRKASMRTNDKFVQAWSFADKSKKLYRLSDSPGWLPNPVRLPNGNVRKSDVPTVCFLGRWDARKRVEWFFRLAKLFPNIDFIAMGKCSPQFDDYDKFLRDEYGRLPNLTLTGFVSEDEKSSILGKSWCMINTSWRECLPVAYLESLAHHTPIISFENPDNLPKSFGYHVESGSFDEYVSGLKWLLRQDWMGIGDAGFEYVKKHHEFDKVISQHEGVYNNLMDGCH